MATSPLRKPVSFSERCYRLLLLAYPREFRQAYGREMIQTLRNYRQEMLQEYGRWGMVHMWKVVGYDLATTVLVEHARALMTGVMHLFGLEGRENTILATQFNLNVAQLTDVGRTRENNEDSMASIVPTDTQVLEKKGALFVVADGMGGHTKGEVASKIAVETVQNSYYQNTNEEITSALQHAIQQANAAIVAAGSGMGTTCVAAVLQGNTLYVANVGDSRVYIIRNGEVKQVSEDHSIVAEQMRAGLLTKEQMREHPARNMITRALGEKGDVEVDTFSALVQEGDLLVLCTDGLWEFVSDEEIGAIVQQFGPEESVKHLIQRANEQGGEDNITAVVVRVSA